ncbi:MAG: cation transporter [Acidobacteriota bacterium]
MSTHQIAFAVRGMFCLKCAREIERALAQLDGVVAAQVNYATERATLVYDPTRVTALKMVNAIRNIGFDTPVEVLTWHSDDLLYATSARTVARALEKGKGVMRAAADLAAHSVTVEVFPEYARSDYLERLFSALGFRVDNARSADGWFLFCLRVVLLIAIEFLALWSAGAHAGFLVSASSLHTPLIVVLLSFITLFTIGLPFYRFASDAMLQGEYDASVMLALMASVFALLSLPVGILSPSPWFTDIGFVVATTLTTGWFITRALTLWVFPRLRVSPPHLRNVRLPLIPLLAGVLAALLMMGVYLGILSALQSPSHAVEQLAIDRVWVGLVALGFGTQIGLYTYLRFIVRAAKAIGATAVTGAGAGTSTHGMLACCAHHLTDVVPLVGLAGASGLSGAIGFFTEWKYAFIALGLVINAAGIIVTMRTIRKSKKHLDAMPIIPEAAPACH